VEHTLLGRRVRDLSYREVSSVTIFDRQNWWLAGLGILLAVVGYALPRLAQLILPYLDGGRPMRFTADGAQWLLIMGVVLAGLGLALVALALVQRRCWVGLDGPFLLRSRTQRRHWSFAAPTPSDARVFATLVRGRLADRATVDGRKVLPHDAF
jgi:H+/Cl- antiporter ClcA